GGPCDRSTKPDDRGARSSQLLSQHNARVSARGRGFRAIFQALSRTTRSGSYTPVPGVSVPREETGCQQRHTKARRTSVFLHQNSETIVERGTDAIPQEGAAAAVHSQPGGSNQPHRIRPHAIPAHSADGALCHWPPSR